jgi:integrase/recombinase XerD
MSHNTVMKHIQRLKKMVTMAYYLEWLEKDPCRRWKTTFEKKEREFLSASELSNLETYEFPVEGWTGSGTYSCLLVIQALIMLI